jgi:hypothetical protein
MMPVPTEISEKNSWRESKDFVTVISESPSA